MILTNTYVSAEHIQPDTNTNQEGFVADPNLVAVACNIQPTAPEMIALYGGAYGKAYTMFTTNSGIRETDRLTQSGTGKTFIVKGLQNFNYFGGQHLEVYLEEVV